MEQVDWATSIILADAVAIAREFLMASERVLGRVVDSATWGRPEELDGRCEVVWYAVYFRLIDSGIQSGAIRQGQSEDLPGSYGVRHAYTVVEMPNGKSYLVDPTLRQFFRSDRESAPVAEDGESQVNARLSIGDPGRFFRSAPDSLLRLQTWELLQDGYIEITPEFIEHYLRT